MASVEVSVITRRKFVPDGVDIVNVILDSNPFDTIVGARLVPLFATGGGITYDVYVTFIVGVGTITTGIRYNIKSFITSVGEGLNTTQVANTTENNFVFTDVHMRDRTGDRRLANVLTVDG